MYDYFLEITIIIVLVSLSIQNCTRDNAPQFESIVSSRHSQHFQYLNPITKHQLQARMQAFINFRGNIVK